MKRTLLSLAIGLGFSASAMAATMPGIPPGPIYIQFNNLEQVGSLGTAYAGKDLNGDGVADVGGVAGTNEFNWGVFNVSSMQSGAVASPHEDIAGGLNFFNNDGTKGQVTGIFYGIEAGGTIFDAKGGYMDIYWNNVAPADANFVTAADLAGGFAPGTRSDWNKAGKFTSGTLMLRLKFAPGVHSGDNVTTFSSSQDPTNFSGTGQADGFADVVDINGDGKIDAADGAWAAAWNGDWFYVDTNGNGTFGEAGEKRDLRFSTFFQNLNSWDCPSGACQGLRSNDPARFYAVPEPASLALMGMGMLGMGLAKRRRKSA